MALDVSGVGSIITLIASNTFPTGVILTQMADDADPIDLPAVQIADKSMDLNGGLVIWGVAKPILASLNVIAGSTADLELGILATANKVGVGQPVNRDVITINIVYPDLSFTNLINGAITDFMPGKSIASGSFRLKTKKYDFAFESKIGA